MTEEEIRNDERERQGEAYTGRGKRWRQRQGERLKEGERYREKTETETGREIKTVRENTERQR